MPPLPAPLPLSGEGRGSTSKRATIDFSVLSVTSLAPAPRPAAHGDGVAEYAGEVADVTPRNAAGRPINMSDGENTPLQVFSLTRVRFSLHCVSTATLFKTNSTELRKLLPLQKEMSKDFFVKNAFRQPLSIIV